MTITPQQIREHVEYYENLMFDSLDRLNYATQEYGDDLHSLQKHKAYHVCRIEYEGHVKHVLIVKKAAERGEIVYI